MSRPEIVKEIRRIEAAIRKTQSDTLRRDYGKRLKRLRKQLRYSGEG